MHKQKKTSVSTFSIKIESEDIVTVPLEKFCCRKIFEIVIANVATIKDNNLMSQLVYAYNTNDIKSVNFITPNDINIFLKMYTEPNEEIYPPTLLQNLKNFATKLQSTDMDCNDLSIAIKFKLVDIMYKQYAKKVIETRRWENNSKQLQNLTDMDIKNLQKELSKSITNIRKSKSQVYEPEDYTLTPLKESDVVVKDDIKEQIYFYILTDVPNFEVIKHLYNMGVHITAVMQVSEELIECKYTPFWEHIHQILLQQDPHNELVNFMLMKYTPNTKDYKDFFVLLQSIMDHKRMHHNYLTSLSLVNTVIKTDLFKTNRVYDKILERYPLETITIPMILDAIVQEIHVNNERNFDNIQLSDKKDDYKHGVLDKPIQNKSKQFKEPLKIYHNDKLNLRLQYYNEIDLEYMKKNLHVLGIQHPLMFFQVYDIEVRDEELTHTHDIQCPNVITSLLSEEQIDYIINLMYLYRQNKTFKTKQNTDIFVYDPKQYWERAKPKLLDKNDFSKKPYISSSNNLFASPKSMEYCWLEIISKEVFLQYLYSSSMEFNYIDYFFCPMTKTLIIKYHDDLDSLGLNTKLWDQHLRTPVGFGEYCRYIKREEAKWIEQNPPYPQIYYSELIKSYENETTERLINSNLYDEYKSLLNPRVQYLTFDMTGKCPCYEYISKENCCPHLKDFSSFSLNEKRWSLSKILEQLEEYNKQRSNVKEFVNKGTGKKLIAYDLETNRFSLTGHRNHFQSHDGMSVSVDTGRLRWDEFKMFTKILTSEATLYLHTPQERFYFHTILSDDTIFVVSKQEPTKLPEKKNSTTTIAQAVRQMLNKAQDTKYEIEDDKTIPSIDYEQYKDLEKFPTIGPIIRMAPSYRLMSNIKKDQKMLKLLKYSNRMIKISKYRRKNYKYLSKNHKEIHVSAGKIAKRVLDAPKQNFATKSKKKCIMDEHSKVPNNLPYNYKMTFPNGLFLKSAPFTLSPDTMVIEQRYILNSTPTAVIDEKYRLFTLIGTVVVRRVDGSFSLLMSSGHELTFRKPKTKFEVGKSRCTFNARDPHLFMKKLFKIIPTNFESSEAFSTFVSRRGHLKSRRHCRPAFDLDKLPFRELSFLSYDGYETLLKNGKLKMTRLLKTIRDIDHRSQEIFSQREDGFVASVKGDGTRVVKFLDGTVIRTCLVVHDKPLFFSKGDKMGWVLITSNYVYEHPNYIPITFDNQNDRIVVNVDNNTILNIFKDNSCLNVGNEYKLKIGTSELTCTKTCTHCGLPCVCTLNIQDMFEHAKPNDQDVFLSVKDSYNKIFRSNFLGECWVNTNFIQGRFNQKYCDHFVMRNYKNVFLLKSDGHASLLRSESFITSNIKDSDASKMICNYENSENKLMFMTILKNVEVNFRDRYLKKGKEKQEKKLAYQLVQNIYSMFKVDQIDDLLLILGTIFRVNTSKLDVRQSIVEVEKSIRMSKSIFSIQSKVSVKVDKVKKDHATLDDKLKESSKKKQDAMKIFKKKIPSYFESDLCNFPK